jgi:DNA-binding MarR family transcriptional regulator
MLSNRRKPGLHFFTDDPSMPRSFDFRHAPGHLIRRAHQRAVAVFMEETAGFDVTPVQFAILNVLIDEPGTDQVTLASRVQFDAATSGSVIGRLEARGWVRREADTHDRRRKLLWLTPEGEQVAQKMKAAATRAQSRMLAPLSGRGAQTLLRLLARMADGA